jgi:CRISPR-associated protein Cas2
VQKSIFLAEAPFAVYEEIKTDLANVQAVYENNDSIIVLPITTDYLQMMKIIGKEIDVDIITRQKSTIFF